jgi:hypothetical protein
VGIDARMDYQNGSSCDWQKEIEDWRLAGATHISLDTMGCGFRSPKDHINALRKFSDETGIFRA